jgi:hypothetical protein
MKMKHNKKRNTAFIFEALIRELTKTIISKDEEKRMTILSLIRENFKSNTVIARDLDLYKSIMDTRDVDRRTAEKIIFESKVQKRTINHKKLFEEQTALIDTINKEVSSSVFSNFVPNYKDMATIFQIFHPRTKTSQRVIFESQIVESMISNEEKERDLLKPIDNLTYKTFVSKFNEKYGNSLLEEQKELLKRYIESFVDNGIELKMFLSDEIPRLEEQLKSAINHGTFGSDEEMLSGANQVMELLENLRKRPVDNTFIHDILKIQNLIKETQN